MSRTTVTYNGVDLTELCIVSDLRTSLLPREVQGQEVPGRDGTLFGGVRLAERTVTLAMTVHGDTDGERQAAARALAAALATDAPAPLAISVDGGRYWMAVPTSGSDAVRWRHHTSFEVEFLCPDPVAYGETRTVSVPSGGSVALEVGGTYPTRPVVSASAALNDGTAGEWRLTLDGGTYLSADAPTARSVVADCAERTLVVAGATAMLDPYADWLVLEPGAHTLAMTGTGAASVSYTERWL